MVKATIQLPASKSISNRALIINALGKGIYPPENLSDCDDTQVMIKALTEGKETIDIMAAGTAMRFLTAYLSATSENGLSQAPPVCSNARYRFWSTPFASWELK